MDGVSKQMQSAIPTDFNFDVGANIKSNLSGINGKLLSSANQINNTNTPINIKITQGNITVQGNMDTSTLDKVRELVNKSANETVNKVFSTMRTLNINSGFVPSV